jgi:Arc/MetJ-type ribon-helix-helix transcriptional regulator
MKTTVQARLDPESSEALETLSRRLGLSRSEVIRASLRRMVQENPDPQTRKPKFLGIGEFDSGLGDLATNKKYMEDFGLTRQQRLERENAKAGKTS